MKTKNILILLILVSALTVKAQNSNDALRLSENGIISSGKALGMGNAISTVGGDFSSIFINPAGLGLLNSSEVSFGLYNNNFSNNSSYMGNFINGSSNSTNLSQFGLTYKFPTNRGTFVVALGYFRSKDFNAYSQFGGYNGDNNSMIQDLTTRSNLDYSARSIPYELGLSYPVATNRDSTLIKGRLLQNGKTVDKGGVDNWSFAGAMEVQPNLFIGATLNVISGSFNRQFDYSESDKNGIYAGRQLDPTDPTTLTFLDFNYSSTLNWEISGWSMQFGLVYKFGDYGAIGGAIQLPKYYTIKERFDENGSSDFANQSYFVDPTISSATQYDIRTPFEFSFGASYKFGGRLLLSADCKYIDYTQMKFTSGLDESYMNQINSSIQTDYRSVLNYNIGAELDLFEIGLKIRGGFMMLKSPYYGDPTDFDKKFLTGGIGIPFNRLELSLAIAYGWWKDYGYPYDSASNSINQDITSTTLLASFKYFF